MSQYFPVPEQKRLFDTIEARVFKLGDAADTTLLITVMPPGASAPEHHHEEHQIGLCLAGSFTMQVAGETRRLEALREAYWAPGGTPHAAWNDGSEPAITLDIKRRPQADERHVTPAPAGETFIPLSPERTIKGGLGIRFFVGPWFEIMLSHLPPSAIMPRHSHRGIQIGIGVSGAYTMEVADETRSFGRHDVYFAPDHVPHAGYNEGAEDATSLNVFIPPRWNLLPKRLRA